MNLTLSDKKDTNRYNAISTGRTVSVQCAACVVTTTCLHPHELGEEGRAEERGRERVTLWVHPGRAMQPGYFLG